MKHPLYDSIGRFLCANEDMVELRVKFWELVENVLKENPTRLQQLAVLKIFSSIVNHIEFDQVTITRHFFTGWCGRALIHASFIQIHPLLTPTFVEHVINSCRSSGTKDKLSVHGKDVLQSIVSRINNCKEALAPASVFKILCQLTFDSGNLLIEKITGKIALFLC